ncbi:hypothetical protein J6590_003883 [Homalodisca vitripennis]|nr:hypothetical protein J6590_003883 [Homalodisca vitripennis]
MPMYIFMQTQRRDKTEKKLLKKKYCLITLNLSALSHLDPNNKPFTTHCFSAQLRARTVLTDHTTEHSDIRNRTDGSAPSLKIQGRKSNPLRISRISTSNLIDHRPLFRPWDFSYNSAILWNAIFSSEIFVQSLDE